MIKNKEEILLMETAGNIVAKTHKHLIPYIKPGITTKELEELAKEYIENFGATSSFKGLYGYPAYICTSINEEVVHGIPSDKVLKDGDIISIDIGVCYKRYHADSAWTYAVGNISKEKRYLLEHTKKALEEGLKKVKVGNRIGDISKAIDNYATSKKLGIVKELIGHGIGKKLHEYPGIPNFIDSDIGPIIEENMVIAIEPMLNLGSHEVWLLDDDWTIAAQDGLPSAHFEHTVLVTKEGYKILTKEVENG